ncbi:MAG: hypothetical protein ACFFD2_07550 [Promethearchaeota archaeon]
MESSEVKWFSRCEKDQEKPLTVFITELENGVFLVISDKGPRLGTIAIGIPTPLVKLRVNISSMPIIFGIKNDLLTRAIAERVAHYFQKIVIVSTFLTEESPESAQRSLKFAEESIREFFPKK